jgi:purine-binding chemotaxis protein CheW
MTREQATAPAAHRGLIKPDDHRCFTVVSEGRTFGLPVEAIQTVFEMVALTPVPLAPYEILGLVNLRGKIVTAVSLRRRLHPDVVIPETSMLAIGMEHRGESFALVVDEVGDVIMLDPGTRIAIPPHLGAEEIKLSAVHRLDAMILPLLDLDWVFTFSRAT